MVFAAVSLIRPQRIVGRAGIGDLDATDFDDIDRGTRILHFSDATLALIFQLAFQQVVSRFEQNPHGSTFLQKGVAANHGDVRNHLGTQDAREAAFTQAKLVFEALVQLRVGAAQHDHAAEVSAVLFQQLSQPDVVLELRESDVKAFLGDATGNVFNPHIGICGGNLVGGPRDLGR